MSQANVLLSSSVSFSVSVRLHAPDSRSRNRVTMRSAANRFTRLTPEIVLSEEAAACRCGKDPALPRPLMRDPV